MPKPYAKNKLLKSQEVLKASNSLEKHRSQTQEQAKQG